MILMKIVPVQSDSRFTLASCKVVTAFKFMKDCCFVTTRAVLYTKTFVFVDFLLFFLYTENINVL